VTTPQFMPGILRWGEFREQFNEGLDAGNCAGYPQQSESHHCKRSRVRIATS
jgi:hypothetical protein